MNVTETQLPQAIIDIIEKEEDDFSKTLNVQYVGEIQKANPINDQLKWFRVENVVCIYVDMIGSTKLSAESRAEPMAKIYKLFTQTIVEIFHKMEAPYVDIKGDGVFALFNKNQCYRAIVSAVHVKTFVEEEFIPKLKEYKDLNDNEKNIGVHIGIDQGTLLVRRIGLKMIDRTDRQNEVWAGKVVNMAAKLASLTKSKELLVSERFYKNISSEYVRKSCDCSEKTELWTKIDISYDDKFDFDTAYMLNSKWCPKHGVEYAKKLLELDNK